MELCYSRRRMPLLPRFSMACVTCLLLATVDRSLIGGVSATDMAEVEKLMNPSSDSGSSRHSEHSPLTDKSQQGVGNHRLQDSVDSFYQQLTTADNDNDEVLPYVSHREQLHQPETRRASTGLRLIGLGKRPSASNSSPLKYIGLGKRMSAIKYIGLGKRTDVIDEGRDSMDTYSNALGERRRRRDVPMRLIGLGRRAEYPPLHQLQYSPKSLTGSLDDEEIFTDDNRLRNTAFGGISRQPWHLIKRRAGGNENTVLRRMQLRRWSSSPSAGSHVDPALLTMGIGK